MGDPMVAWQLIYSFVALHNFIRVEDETVDYRLEAELLNNVNNHHNNNVDRKKSMKLLPFNEDTNSDGVYLWRKYSTTDVGRLFGTSSSIRFVGRKGFISLLLVSLKLSFA
jgi:hypothetical protein